MRWLASYCRLAFFVLALATVVGDIGLAAEDAPEALHRDPFDTSAIRPPALASTPEQEPDAAEAAFELRATLVAKEQPFANLNGQILTVGETINGYRLREIAEGQVVLERDGKSVTVSLPP